MEAKIEIKVGEVSFIGEGTENWLSTQLDKMLKHLPDLLDAAPPMKINPATPGGTPAAPAQQTGTLASFLTARDAKTNQRRKFLATALWLQNGGKNRVDTGDVTKALRDNSQSKLNNASDCLNGNVQQGFCEKDGKQFYVTEEGRAEIG
jgi:hypothetical protein